MDKPVMCGKCHKMLKMSSLPFCFTCGTALGKIAQKEQDDALTSDMSRDYPTVYGDENS
jgi:hypothetical protein